MPSEPKVTVGQRLRHALNLSGRQAPCLIAALLLLGLPLLGGDTLREALRYDRMAIASGELWRFATAHIVHLDLWHAVLNALGLLLLWVLLAGLEGPRYWLRACLLAMLAIGAGFWWLQPGLAWYVGASGVLHGIMAAGLVALFVQRERIALPAALVFAAKLTWEQGVGPLPLETHTSVIVAAHLYGALGGVVAGLLSGVRRTGILRPPHLQDGR